jgi:hypothetical protein
MVTATPIFHVHPCSLCGEVTSCAWSDCLLTDQRFADHEDGPPIMLAAGHRMCSDCERGFDEVDALPPVARGPLGGGALIRVVARGTRAALGMAARDPERAPDELARHVDPLAPVDETKRDSETWFRIGAVCGAKDAWAGTPFRIPPDAPPGEPACAYLHGWSNAASVVMQIRLEVG